MAILKDHAQVLRMYEQGNTSLVAVLLGRGLGQFRVHVKGGRRWSRKGFEGGFDLLTRGEILVYPRAGERLWIFREWDERVRPRLGASLSRLRAASYLCELAEALTRETAGSGAEGHAALYDALCAAADGLAAGVGAGHVCLRFTLRALLAEGLLGDPQHCAACGVNLLRLARQGRPAWLGYDGFYCGACVPSALGAPNLTRPFTGLQGLPETRGVWLSPEAQAVLQAYAGEFLKGPLVFQAPSARQLAYALLILVHGALERDLRTLVAAGHAVARAGVRAAQKPPAAASARRGAV